MNFHKQHPLCALGYIYTDNHHYERNYYHHMSTDGLHLTDILKDKWADQFVKAFSKN